jgi:hypothetical protein
MVLLVNDHCGNGLDVEHRHAGRICPTHRMDSKHGLIQPQGVFLTVQFDVDDHRIAAINGEM